MTETLRAPEDYLEAARTMVATPTSPEGTIKALSEALAEAYNAGSIDGANLTTEAAQAQAELDGTLALDRDQVRELTRIAFAMPYAGGLPSFEVPGHIVGPRPVDPARLLLWLDQLRERLVDAATRAESLQNRVYRLEGQRTAVREFLGIPADGIPTPTA